MENYKFVLFVNGVNKSISNVMVKPYFRSLIFTSSLFDNNSYIEFWLSFYCSSAITSNFGNFFD